MTSQAQGGWEWRCSACTLINPTARSICGLCSAPRPSVITVSPPAPPPPAPLAIQQPPPAMQPLMRITVRSTIHPRGWLLPFPHSYDELLDTAHQHIAPVDQSASLSALQLYVNRGRITAASFCLLRDRDVIDALYVPAAISTSPPSPTAASVTSDATKVLTATAATLSRPAAASRKRIALTAEMPDAPRSPRNGPFPRPAAAAADMPLPPPSPSYDVRDLPMPPNARWTDYTNIPNHYTTAGLLELPSPPTTRPTDHDMLPLSPDRSRRPPPSGSAGMAEMVVLGGGGGRARTRDLIVVDDGMEVTDEMKTAPPAAFPAPAATVAAHGSAQQQPVTKQEQLSTIHSPPSPPPPPPPSQQTVDPPSHTAPSPVSAERADSVQGSKVPAPVVRSQLLWLCTAFLAAYLFVSLAFTHMPVSACVVCWRCSARLRDRRL